MPPGARIRLFVAIPVPIDVARILVALVPAGLRGLKRVEPDLLHVTLAFIGWTDEETVAVARAAVARSVAGQDAFDVALDEIGRFPPTGRPRVLWAGSRAATPSIEALASAVRDGLTAAGIPFDPKPPRPHITLARSREDIGPEDARAVAAAARAVAVPRGAAFRADAVHVMQSTLTPRGPRYSSRSVVRLGLPDAGPKG